MLLSKFSSCLTRRRSGWWTAAMLLVVVPMLLLLLLTTGPSSAAAGATHMKRKKPSDFLVQGLEEIEPAFGQFPGEMYSGLLPVDHHAVAGGQGAVKGELMFWLFAPDEPAGVKNKKTLTAWLNGGPGCSSFFAGAFMEHGVVSVPLQPAGICCIDEHAPLQPNPHSWALSTHMLYVEQPVSVGFSTGGPLPQNETQVGADFYAFLQNFFATFSHYQDYDFHLFGESYAGMYVPSIAHYVFQQNSALAVDKKKKSDMLHIPLAGIGIGNGLLDSRVQGPIRIDYAYFHGLIDSYTRDNLYLLWELCIDPTKKMEAPIHSFNVPDDCGMLTAIPLAAGRGAAGGGPNVYDITTWDPYAVLGGDDNTISRFYNNPAVKEKLHAPADTFWRGCLPGAGRRRLFQQQRMLVSSFLINDKPISTVPYIAELLDGGVRVLMYYGDRDMACNLVGAEKLLNEMNWHGSDEWYSTPRGLWTSHDNPYEPAGFAKSHSNLDFVVVYNSGHLVPYNQPANALDLLRRFVDKKSFYDHELPNFGDYVDHMSMGTTKSGPTTMLSQASVILDASSLNQASTETVMYGIGILPIILAFVVGFGLAYLWQQRNTNARYERI